MPKRKPLTLSQMVTRVGKIRKEFDHLTEVVVHKLGTGYDFWDVKRVSWVGDRLVIEVDDDD